MRTMRGVGILLTLVLLSVTLTATAEPTITFSGQAVSADLVTGKISYDGLADLQISNGVSLATTMIFVPLAAGQTAADVSFQANTEVIGTIPIALLSDIPTALFPERFADAVAKWSEHRPGRQAVEVIDETMIGGKRCARVQVFPVSVGADGAVVLNKDIEIRLADLPIAPDRVLSAAEAASLANNDANGDRSPSGTSAEFLIVTSPDLAPAMHRLAAYRTVLGITTDVRTVDDLVAGVSGRDMAERLRQSLKLAYQNGCHYVLLAGDETQVPVRYAYPYSDSPMPTFDEIQITDLYFADLTGNWNADNDSQWGERYTDQVDQTPELMVGRLPFATNEEAEQYVDKVILYETNPGDGDLSYLRNVMFFTSDQMRDPSFGTQHAFVAQAFPSSLTVDTITGVEQSSGLDADPSNLDAPAMVDVLSQGYGIVNVQAHGAAGQFAVRTSGYDAGAKSCIVSNPEIPGHGPITNLEKNDHPGFWYSIACENGGFDLDAAPYPYPERNLAQVMLGLERSGAVAMVAYSRYGWVALSYQQQRTFFDSLFAHPDRPAIKALYAEKAVHASYRDLVYGQNFLGDPTIHVYTTTPKRLAVETRMQNTNLLVVVTENGAFAAGATVIVSQNGAILGQFTTDAQGQVNLGQSLTGVNQYTIASVKTGCSSAIIGFLPYIATDVTDDNDALPSKVTLAQNYPNPFNPSTVIRFALPATTYVKLTVYNILGQEVAILVNGQRSAGTYEISWDADERGGGKSSGMYYYRLEAGGVSETKKMVLVR